MDPPPALSLRLPMHANVDPPLLAPPEPVGDGLERLLDSAFDVVAVGDGLRLGLLSSHTPLGGGAAALRTLHIEDENVSVVDGVPVPCPWTRQTLSMTGRGWAGTPGRDESCP